MPTRKKRPADTLRPEYDFRGGTRGKYAPRVAEGAVTVTLDPDVAAVYPTAAAVNRALRALIAARAKATRRP